MPASHSRSLVVSGARVLVVDENRVTLDAVWTALLDCRVAADLRASDAIARIERGERFDVVFCGLMMDQMTGLYLRVARIDPEQADRVVFLTGTGGLSDEFLAEHRALEAPFGRAEIRAMTASVRELCEEARSA